MPSFTFEHSLLIANPAAHSGKGAEALTTIRQYFDQHTELTPPHIVLTQGPHEAERLVAKAARYDSVIALGGDGIVHEIVAGLMQLPRDHRPALGLIPMGSGNDFARSIGMYINKPINALQQLYASTVKLIDLGEVKTDFGEHACFIETLSFGTDAAIGLDTIKRREEHTSARGTHLFATSGLRLIATGRNGIVCNVSIDHQPPHRYPILIFAVQNGPTYGGGFRICPKAHIDDGKLDTCFNVKYANIPHFLQLFCFARFGGHARSHTVHLQRLEHLEADFLGIKPPCQVDGEPLAGSRFTVDVLPHELSILSPSEPKRYR
jgi:YegS/Rv2252/BmrU family lipid kinase